MTREREIRKNWGKKLKWTKGQRFEEIREVENRRGYSGINIRPRPKDFDRHSTSWSKIKGWVTVYYKIILYY